MRRAGESARGVDHRRGGAGGDSLRVVIPAVLAVCVVAAFFPVFTAGFLTWDDPGYVYENPMVSRGLSTDFVGWAFTTFRESNWHPLTWISHALDVTIFGLNAGAHHAMNLFFHLLSTLLLYAVLRRATGDRWKAAFVALVFGIHPLHVESVAWVSERKDVLSAFFLMLTLGSYVNWTARGNRKHYVLAVVFFAAGLLSKPMLVTVPFVLLLLDYWPLGRMGGSTPALPTPGRSPLPIGRLVKEKTPFFLLAAGSAVVTYVAQEKGGATAALGALPFAARAANAVTSYIGYLSKAVWPVDLAFFYPHRLSGIGAGEVALSLAALAGVTYACWRFRKRAPWFTVGWLLFAGMLVPVIGIVQVGLQAMADRYMYLPIIGLAVIAAWGVPAVLGRVATRRALLGGAVAASALAMGVATWNQARVWAASGTLYARALEVTEGNHIAHANIGVDLLREGRASEAIPHLAEALRLWPGNLRSMANYAYALAGAGRYADALPHYRELLKKSRPSPLLHLRAGDVYTGLGAPDSALSQYQRAVELDPKMVDAWVGIADAASSLSEFDRAREAVRRALAVEPGSSRAHDMLGIVAGRQGRMDEAEAEFRKAIAADSTNAAAYVDLGILFEMTGRADESRGMFGAAVRVDPRSSSARFRLGIAMARSGDTDGAEAQWRECISLAPPAVEARMNLGRLYAMRGDTAKAVAEYEAVVAAAPAYTAAAAALRALGSSGRR